MSVNDEAATWGVTLEEQRPYLLMLARITKERILQPELDPSDAVQQTFLKAFGGRDQYRGTTDAELKAWLRAILSHVIADAGRKRGKAARDVSLAAAIDDSARIMCDGIKGPKGLIASSTSPSGDAIRRERSQLLWKAFESLDEDMKRAVILHYFMSLKVREIADKMECTGGRVAGLLKHGVAKLRRLLEEALGS